MKGTERSEFMNRKKRSGRLARLRWLLALSLLCCPALAWGRSQEPTQLDCGSPLLRAIYKRDLREIRRIIDSGSGLNFKGCELGSTPLIESIGERLPEVAKKLILAGADPNLAAEDGTTPLIQASWYCHEQLVSSLLERGAAVNSTAKNGDSALLMAAHKCHDGKIVQILLQSGATVNLRTKYGETPLTIAAFYGNEEAVKALVAAGADVNSKTDEGKTALTLARDRVVGRTKAHDRIYAFLLGLADR